MPALTSHPAPRTRMRPTLAARLLLVTALGWAPGCATTLDKAQQAHQDGALDDAQVLYEKAAGKADTQDEATVGLAELFVLRGKRVDKAAPAKAEAHYREALALVPAHEAALTSLVRLLRREGELSRAREAIVQAEATGNCGGCKRLTLVIVLDGADQAFAAGDCAAARTLYETAQAQRAQPGVAVAIAATHLEVAAMADAETALLAAVPLMLAADVSTRDRFVAIRVVLLSAAIKAADFPRADQLVAMVLPKEPSAEKTERSLRIAHAVFEGGDAPAALERYATLLAIEGDEALSQTLQTSVTDRMATIYAGRGTTELHAGRATEAQAELELAIALRPTDWLLKLQRILALSSRTGATPALASLKKVPAKTPGLAHTRAILLSLEVRELVSRGELELAAASLAKAQRAHPDLPEVHLAAAYVLARTPTDELEARDRKALLGRKSLVTYDGEVFRYAEALAELSWVRSEMDDRKPDYPFTAAWLASSSDALRSSLASVYPYAVEFQPEPEPLVLLHNRGGGFIEVSVSGPDGFSDELGIPPGDTREVVPPDSGLLKLRVGRAKRVYYAEGYAKVIVDLP